MPYIVVAAEIYAAVRAVALAEEESRGVTWLHSIGASQIDSPANEQQRVGQHKSASKTRPFY
jgi:hypothetical protein